MSDLTPYVRLSGRAKLVRLVNPTTNEYLHFSAEFDVKATQYAWAGTGAQARKLRAKATAKGSDFPYKARLVREPVVGTY